ncbi:hypothetical protein [Streptomyces sp. NPDC050535]|uniref:hypothetical protein n=1 Tax=Streptomyces sp. NPDC050535 TaxID=3365626 RepID=UPI0037A464A9
MRHTRLLTAAATCASLLALTGPARTHAAPAPREGDAAAVADGLYRIHPVGTAGTTFPDGACLVAYGGDNRTYKDLLAGPCKGTEEPWRVTNYKDGRVGIAEGHKSPWCLRPSDPNSSNTTVVVGNGCGGRAVRWMFNGSSEAVRIEYKEGLVLTAVGWNPSLQRVAADASVVTWRFEAVPTPEEPGTEPGDPGTDPGEPSDPGTEPGEE